MMLVGVYRLVCGDQDEFLHPIPGRSLGQFIGAFHIVFDRLVGAVFHQRHVLVGRCVVDHFGTVCLDNAVDPVGVAHRSDQCLHGKVRIFALQLLLNGISIIFINIKDNQQLWLCLGDLTAQFASDGTTQRSTVDHLVVECLEDLAVIDFYLGSAKKVCNLHVPQSGDADLSAH